MADEVQLKFTQGGTPETILAAWRATPPTCLVDEGFAIVDESYDTLVFEANVTSRWVRVTMFGMATTLYRLSVTFRQDPDRRGSTRVTLTGQAPERAREELAAMVAAAS